MRAFEDSGGGTGGGAGSAMLGSSKLPPHSLTTSVTAPDAADSSAEPSAAVKATSIVLTTDPAACQIQLSGSRYASICLDWLRQCQGAHHVLLQMSERHLKCGRCSRHDGARTKALFYP